MKIRNRLLLYFIGLTAFSLLIIASDSFYNVDKNIVSNAETKLEAIATIQENRVNSELNNYKIQVSQVAGRTSLTDDVVNFNNTKDPSAVTSLKTRAQDVKTSVSDYKEVFILDSNGQVIASNDEKSMGDYIDISNLDDLKIENKVFVSKEISPSKDLVLTGPIRKNDEFVGLIVIVTQAKELKNIVTDYTGLEITGETLIVFNNTEGKVNYISQPRFSDPNKIISLSKNQTNIAAIQGLLKNETLLKKSVDYRNQPIYAVTKYISGTDWGLVVKIDKSELYAPIYSHAIQLGIICLFLLIITVVISFKLANAVSRPIEALTTGAEKIEKGNFTHKVAVTTKDEFGKLATTFNNMISAIISSRADVDKKVKEQTGEIEEKQQDMENQQKAILNILEDVEEEKNITAKEKEKATSMLESIGDGVIGVDDKLNIITINQAALDILGYEKNDLINKGLSHTLKLLDKDGKAVIDMNRPINQVLKKPEKHSYKDLSYIRKDGTACPINLTITPIILNEKIIGAINVFRDITKERQVDQAKTEFVSLASHQLRTPLSAINWYAEMLINGDVGKLTPDQLKYMQEVYKGNQRMVNLVNALLDVSRIELGTFAIEPKNIKIGDFANDIVNEVKHDAEKKKININTNYDKNVPEIMADPKLIQIIIQNLLSNAVKYTPEKGQVSLTITKKDPNMLIEVKDTGYGIPKNQHSQIFTKLFRADNVRAKDTEGTGLGLYIVKAIVDQSGGSILFTSEENKGTTFFVSLPLKGMPKKEGTKALEDIK